MIDYHMDFLYIYTINFIKAKANAKAKALLYRRLWPVHISVSNKDRMIL